MVGASRTGKSETGANPTVALKGFAKRFNAPGPAAGGIPLMDNDASKVPAKIWFDSLPYKSALGVNRKACNAEANETASDS
jgi:hypothetical protein